MKTSIYQKIINRFAVRQSDARFRELFENANDLVYTTDFRGYFTSLNKAGEEITGYTREEFCQKKFTEIVVPEQHEIARRLPRLKPNENVPATYEIDIITKNGTRVSLDVSSRLIYEDGAPIGVQGIGRDVTARKRTEEELKKNLSLLSSTFEATADGILVVDRDNKIVAYNRNFVEMSRLPEAIIESRDNQKVVNFVLDQLIDPEAFLERTKQLHLQPEIHSYDIVEFKDGRMFERYSHPQVLDGKVVGRVISFRDVAERKKAVEELEKNLSLLTSTLEATGDGILVVDRNSKIVTYNRKYLEIWQISDEMIASMDNEKLIQHVSSQLINADNFINTTKQLNSKAEFENFDLLEFRDGRIYERHSHPQVLDGEVVGRVISFRDITERKRTEDTLRESESLLAAAQRLTHLGSWELDLSDSENLDKNEVRWSDETYRIFGYEPGEIVTSNEVIYSMIHLEDRERVRRELKFAVEEEEVFKIEYRIVLPDGNERIISNRAQLVFDNQTNKPLKMLGTIKDITERKQADAALYASENRYRLLVESTNEGLLQVDIDDRTQFVNDRFCEMVGYPREILMNSYWAELLLDEEGVEVVRQMNERRRQGISDRYEMRLKRKSGETLWVIVGGAPLISADGTITGSMGVFTDITERKRAEEQLLHDAFHDGLTGLANRALFMDHLQLTIERGKNRNTNLYAVLFLDFDRFKIINDSLGHAEGDRLLKQIVERLEAATRTGDLVARFGGDEFVVLLCEMADENDAVQIAERIQNSLKPSFNLSGNEVFVSVSIGIALSTAGHKRAEDMLRDADTAMYRAKAKGRAQYQIFDQTMHQQAATQLHLETEMRQALERGEFQIYYQPIINLETYALAGFEALVRWIHPKRGTILPMEFIPVAEETGLILPLGRWIVEESCRQMRQWQIAQPLAAHLVMSVNLSCKQFLQSDLAEQVAQTLASTGLPPHCLKLEITESHLMENSEKIVGIMKRLCNLGVELSLDDFGTGYSSLSYLHRLPVDYLKIDRSFVSRMTESLENSEIVLTIIKLAQNLKMKVIAEGIETAEQLLHLKNQECEFGQGYFFSKPLEASEAANLIEFNAKNFPFVMDQTDIEMEMNM